MKALKWGEDLILDALKYLNTQGYNADIPEVKWRKPVGRKNSSGFCYPDHITICAGKDRTDCKLVILHELAHWVLPGNEHHSDKFWGIAWDLYRHFKLPIRYCLNREKYYRKGAAIAYKRSK